MGDGRCPQLYGCAGCPKMNRPTSSSFLPAALAGAELLSLLPAIFYAAPLLPVGQTLQTRGRRPEGRRQTGGPQTGGRAPMLEPARIFSMMNSSVSSCSIAWRDTPNDWMGASAQRQCEGTPPPHANAAACCMSSQHCCCCCPFGCAPPPHPLLYLLSAICSCCRGSPLPSPASNGRRIAPTPPPFQRTVPG